eukprot:3928253-Prymnesium_polylepis.2
MGEPDSERHYAGEGSGVCVGRGSIAPKDPLLHSSTTTRCSLAQPLSTIALGLVVERCRVRAPEEEGIAFAALHGGCRIEVGTNGVQAASVEAAVVIDVCALEVVCGGSLSATKDARRASGADCSRGVVIQSRAVHALSNTRTNSESKSQTRPWATVPAAWVEIAQCAV